MKIELIRYNHDKNSTSGILAINGEFSCFTLEDEKRSVKVKGETRIPEGTYKIKKREVVSGLTQTYRDKFDFFDFHLELQDVPNFKYVYIHVGNWEHETDGCILVADQAVNNPDNYESEQFKSKQAFKRIYDHISHSLSIGEEVEIEIKSIWNC